MDALNMNALKSNIKHMTKEKFDNLLKEALPPKQPNKNVEKPLSEKESLSSNEDVDFRNEQTVVQVDVHENIEENGDNFILTKFLNDTTNISNANDASIGENDHTRIKQPIPRPRRRKEIILSPNSLRSSNNEHDINRKSPEDLNNIISGDGDDGKSKSTISSQTVNSQLITDEDLKGDEIAHEEETRSKTKTKHSKNRREQQVASDNKKKNYSYENVISVILHKTDRLQLNSLIIHPLVKIHLVNMRNGEYVKKSDKNRSVVCFNENTDTDFILPVISEPYHLYEKHSFYPAWEESILINEDINYVLDQNVIVFFEILDFVSFSVANSQILNKDSSKGWHKIAWAFLKPVGKNGEMNINRRVRLQLYQPGKHKKIPQHVCLLFYWWRDKKLLKYPSSLHVSVRGIVPPEMVTDALRPKTPIQAERASRTTLDQNENCTRDSLNAGNKINKNNENIKRKETSWSRLRYQLCKFPNKCVAEFPGYEEGCFIVEFSNSGLYLACAVVMDEVHSIVIYDIKSYVEVCKYCDHQGLIYNIRWSTDDQYVITASADCTVGIWSFTDLAFVEMLPHPSYVYTNDINSKNEIATGCYDQIIRIWCKSKTETYELFQELENHKGHVTSLCFNDKGTHLYSSDSVGVIIEWKNDDAKVNWVFRRIFKWIDLKDTVINQILLHTRGKRLLIHARDSTLRLMDLKTGCILHWLHGGLNNRFQTTCSFSSCGNYVFVGGENGIINVWNSDLGQPVATYAPYKTFDCQVVTVHCVKFHPHDNIMAISHYGRSLPILLMIYDHQFIGENSVELNVLQNDKEPSTLEQKIKSKSLEKLKTALSKDNNEQNKQRKVNFEDVIEKMDKIIVDQPSVMDRSHS